ncbi:MAG: DMT family transporter [Rhizobiaceae bacterium]
MFVPRAENPGLAAALILISTAFIAASMTFAKALGTGALGPALHPLQVSQGRFLFAFLLFACVAAVQRSTSGPAALPVSSPIHWKLHLGRSSFGWAGVTLMFASIAYIPMADATAISFLNPVFAMALAIPLLGERVGRVRWAAAAIAFLGAMILLRPTPASFQPGAMLALAAAAVIGMELIFIKKLAGREGPFQILIINNAIGLVIASLAAVLVWQAPTLLQWAGLAAVGLLMACAQVCFINGMARADASYVAPFSYAALVFAALYDFVAFDAVPDWVTWVGAVIILSGALMLALREAHLQRQLTVQRSEKVDAAKNRSV